MNDYLPVRNIFDKYLWLKCIYDKYLGLRNITEIFMPEYIYDCHIHAWQHHLWLTVTLMTDSNIHD